MKCFSLLSSLKRFFQKQVVSLHKNWSLPLRIFPQETRNIYDNASHEIKKSINKEMSPTISRNSSIICGWYDPKLTLEISAQIINSSKYTTLKKYYCKNKKTKEAKKKI